MRKHVSGPDWVLLAVVLGVAISSAIADEFVWTGSDGHIRVQPFPVATEFLNDPWTQEQESGFWERAEHAIVAQARSSCGSTYGENEKGSYPRSMSHFLLGNRSRGIECLEGKDAQASPHNDSTLGIDYYWCFTLKGQMRKYFWFGKHGGFLTPSYQKTMFDAAKMWTSIDPATTPHPVFDTGNGEYGYAQEQRGYRVDRRGTDNLRAMRETSIYLMAEETSNDSIRERYKGKIRDYAVQLYHIGMGEWDSENYLMHTLMPYLNLYDFARDREVKLWAKAVCDWITTAGALKYYRGGFGGPVARDYGGGNVVFGAGSSHAMSIYAGDIPYPDPDPHYDDVYLAMSAYRPPRAVMELARKQFERPVEILSTKPIYQAYESENQKEPNYYETLFFGKSYSLGSLIARKEQPLYDIGPFKLMAENSVRGVDYFIVFSDSNPAPVGRYGEMKSGDQMVQYRNQLIWLRPKGSLKFGFQVPKSAQREKVDGIWFFQMEKTWIAVKPIALGDYYAVDNGFAMYPEELFFHAPITGARYGGLAMEVGEVSQQSYTAFKQAVREKLIVDESALANGTVRMTGTTGARLEMTFNSGETSLPEVIRNGHEVSYASWRELYQPQGEDGPVWLGWKQGTLRVRAGGRYFTQTVSKHGEVNFSFDEVASQVPLLLPARDPQTDVPWWRRFRMDGRSRDAKSLSDYPVSK